MFSKHTFGARHYGPWGLLPRAAKRMSLRGSPKAVPAKARECMEAQMRKAAWAAARLKEAAEREARFQAWRLKQKPQ